MKKPQALVQAWAALSAVSFGQLLPSMVIRTYLIHDANYKTLFLNIVRLNGVIILQNFA